MIGTDLMLVAGVGVLSVALRSFNHRLMHRAGTIGIFLTSFLLGWLLGGHLWLGVLFASSWLFLPWLEILTRVRHLRLPADRIVQPRTPPPAGNFPGFGDLTDEVEEAGFEHVQDAGWEFDGHCHFYRLFYEPSKRMQASICLVEQNGLAFYYVSISSHSAQEGREDQEFLTWNYPFSYGLKLPPHMHTRRIDGEIPFSEMLQQHAEFLAAKELTFEQTKEQLPEAMCEEIRQSIAGQIEHNVSLGLLVREADHSIRYSVRGMFFLWFQFLRDLVRLS